MAETQWIPIDQAEKLTDYTSEYLRSLARQKKINSRKWGFVWQFDRDSLIAYKREQEERRKGGES